MNDIWPMVHAERLVLIADLEQIDDTDWERPSLCDGWTVHDVAAHLVDVARTTRLGLMLDLARSRFDFDRQNARGMERARGRTPQETLQRLRDVARRTSTPPAPLASRLVEEVVHGEDIRRPLGIARAYSEEAVVQGIGYQSRTRESFGGAKELVQRVRFVATDADVSVGEGPEVTGPVLSLLLVLTGRRVALADLRGPGVERV